MIEIIETMTIKPLLIECADKTLELLPVPRSKLPEMRAMFVELQAIWVGNGFGTGETVADDRAWELMSAIAAMLPHKDNPAVTGFNLEPLSNDYELLEKLFLARFVDVGREEAHGWTIATFDLDRFSGCSILTLHCMNPKSVLMDADEWRQKGKTDTVTELRAA
jgi:hypothetical protein